MKQSSSNAAAQGSRKIKPAGGKCGISVIAAAHLSREGRRCSRGSSSSGGEAGDVCYLFALWLLGSSSNIERQFDHRPPAQPLVPQQQFATFCSS